MSIITDNKVLINICSGLKSKNKVTLGLLAALAAENEGHQVTLFGLLVDSIGIIFFLYILFIFFKSKSITLNSV